MSRRLRVVIVKPSKYGKDGYVERFRWGFMPNSTAPYMRSLTPDILDGVEIETHTIDEYVHTDIDYRKYLEHPDGVNTLVALVGVQSHQFHRALDLAAYAYSHGCHAIIGGPHAMTCDTSNLHNSGVSFALAEGERLWESILRDAILGELQPVYGAEQRWQPEINAPVIKPPQSCDLKRYVVPMLGLYPARGCPFSCSFCSVIKIAGRRIRSQSIGTTIDSLKAAKAAGVRLVMFTSDNFNKYPEAPELLNAMIEEKIEIPFFVQCDTQVYRQEEFVELMARAGCYQMFLGVESFNKYTLKAVNKKQNRPELYEDILKLCRKYGIHAHFSNIIGFPDDTRETINNHLEILKQMGPTWASFYILCPIPGTQQYDEFLHTGLINEPNLDRYDTTSLTWNHPNLSKDELENLLFDTYKSFYSYKHAIESTRAYHPKSQGSIKSASTVIAGAFFHRFCAANKTHPMSGGFGKTKVDHVDEYLNLRRRMYGFELAPLPENLELPEADIKTLHNYKQQELVTIAV